MTPRTGVAISTTGDRHRLSLLRMSVKNWDRCLPENASLYVTVDGDGDAVRRVEREVDEWTASVARIGQPRTSDRPSRLGVAANKNTGLEYLMDSARCDRLWLSDDDSWPLSPASLIAHVNIGLPHSMVNWGRHRRSVERAGIASWSWPRGAVMYVERRVVEEVGGFIEAFGTWGHEHVEWSRRIHQAGFTPVPYPSPKSYTSQNFLGARALWHCEDMQYPGEPLGDLRVRRQALSSMRREADGQKRADQIMNLRDGDTTYVPYRASQNDRWSATMSGT